MNTEKLLGRIQVLHKGFRASDHRRREQLAGFWGHAPPGKFEIYALGNTISSVLRGNLSCLMALKSF